MPDKFCTNGEEIMWSLAPGAPGVPLSELEEYLREAMKVLYMRKKMMGYPVIYMNEKGEILEDWQDGRVEVISSGTQETPEDA